VQTPKRLGFTKTEAPHICVSAPDPPALVIRRAGDLTQRTGLSAPCQSYIRKTDALPTSIHLPQSSSSSRFAAAHAGFFILSQSGERPDR
jgi:hypothetical protein